MSIEGRIKRSTASDSMDIVFCSLAENRIIGDGIPTRFQAGLVLRWPASGGHVFANITVDPELAYPTYQPWQGDSSQIAPEVQ